MRSRYLALTILALLAAANAAAAETIKLGTQKVVSGGAQGIPIDKGYFAAEGLHVEIVFFDSAEAIPAAVVSGDVDIGMGGFSAGFYNLAARGTLRIIAASTREYPGFQAQILVASNRAAEAGLKSFAELPGHSVAIAQMGGGAHHTLGLIAEKEGFDLKRVQILALQSNPNAASAVIGGRVDAALVPTSVVKPAIQSGQVKIVGWTSEEVSFQLSGVYAAARTCDERSAMLERFLRAYRKGVAEFHDAFADQDDKRRDGPTAEETVAVIGKYLGQTPEQVRLSIISVDREARLDVKDVLRQIAWYKAQGMLKGEVDADAVIDKRYVVPTP